MSAYKTCQCCGGQAVILYKCGVCGKKVCMKCQDYNRLNACKKCRKEINDKMNFGSLADFEQGVISGGSIRG